MARLLSQVVGHSQVLAKLVAAVQKNRLHSTMLFIGPSGVGKKLSALGLAQVLICEKSDEACGVCPPCLRVAKRQSESLMLVEPTGTQIKIEQAKAILDFISIRQLGKARVIIIDQAHTMNPQAANSLLKSLEEPPENTYFILISPSAGALLATIRSRSQVFRFGSLGVAEISQVTGAEGWVVQACGGRADMAAVFSGHQEARAQAFHCLVTAIEGRESASYVDLKESIKDKESGFFVVEMWRQFLRDVLFRKNQMNPLIHQDFLPLIDDVARLPEPKVHRLADQLGHLEHSLHANADRGLAFQNFLLQINGDH